MKINCLSCGHNVTLEDTYNDYEGPIKCYGCGTLLEVRLSDGCIKSLRVLQSRRRATEPEEEMPHG